jgi:hypothetical protein
MQEKAKSKTLWVRAIKVKLRMKKTNPGTFDLTISLLLG